MAFFLVTMTHPDGDGWGHHVAAHVDYLRQRIADGDIKASGPLVGPGKRAGFIIVVAADRLAAETMIAADPFAVHGLIDELTIVEWNPLFGAFASAAVPYRST